MAIVIDPAAVPSGRFFDPQPPPRAKYEPPEDKSYIRRSYLGIVDYSTTSIKSNLPTVMFIALLFSAAQVNGANTYCVDDNSPATSPDGLGWDNTHCFKYLQDALDAASPGDTIKVAGGTYRADEDSGSINPTDPDHAPNDQNETFSIKVGVKIIGGHAGMALPSTPDVRNITLYQSICTGNIGNLSIETDNTDQIVTILGDASFTELDGLYIMFGHSDDGFDRGVGITVVEPGAKPTIRNCNILDNTNTSSSSYGAGIWFEGDGNNSDDVTIENCQFSGNHAGFGGGALACRLANPTVVDSVFARNSCDREGGAIWMDAFAEEDSGSGTFRNCVIANNTVLPSVLSGSTSVRRGGGVFLFGKPSFEFNLHPTFKNCEFLTNTACAGGGVYCEHGRMDVIGCYFRGNKAISWSSSSPPIGGGMYVFFGNNIFNTKFDSNATLLQSGHGSPTPAGQGGGLYAVKSLPLIVNCAFYRNTSGSGGGMYGSEGGGGIAPAAFLGINNTFSENTAAGEGGGYAGHIGISAAFTNSIFWNNHDGGTSVQDAQVFCTTCGSPPTVPVTYSCVQDDDQNDSNIPFDPTNIDDDPLFRDPSVDNYRLRECSPTIDIGSTPSVPEDALNVDDDTLTTCSGCTTGSGERAPDLDLRDRVLDEPTMTDGTEVDNHCRYKCNIVVDMGAYEYMPLLQCSIMGDMNSDGHFDIIDIGMLSNCLGLSPVPGKCLCGDLNGNAAIDYGDLYCLMDKINYGFSACDGAFFCVFGPFAAPSSGGSGGGQETMADPVTWAALAASGVAWSASECTSPSSSLEDESGGVDVFTIALRWVAFEQWVTAHPVENFSGSWEAYDAWAKLQFGRIVVEGKAP